MNGTKLVEIRCSACGKVLNGRSKSVVEEEGRVVVTARCSNGACRLFNLDKEYSIPKFGFIGDTDNDVGYGE